MRSSQTSWPCVGASPEMESPSLSIQSPPELDGTARKAMSESGIIRQRISVPSMNVMVAVTDSPKW